MHGKEGWGWGLSYSGMLMLPQKLNMLESELVAVVYLRCSVIILKPIWRFRVCPNARNLSCMLVKAFRLTNHKFEQKQSFNDFCLLNSLEEVRGPSTDPC